MNCDHFDQRMQMRLDGRLSLDGDPALNRHAENCSRCRAKIVTWQSIAVVLQPVDSAAVSAPQPILRRPLYPALAVAAVLLISMGFAGFQLSSVQDQSRLAASTAETNGRGDVQVREALAWWASVRDRDWVAQTMPAVRSVQQGVAPLGRSLIQAVTVLTVGDPGQTS